MNIISYLHELFNEQKCNEYIHQLRWQNRQLQCPRCQSYDVKPWDNYHSGRGHYEKDSPGIIAYATRQWSYLAYSN
ncbi:MAG: transposase [Candidatus Poribacteria bacterium]